MKIRKEVFMLVEQLENKVKKLESELSIAKDKLHKATSQNPLVYDECKYDNNKKALVHKYTYFCSYCGESIRKNSKKHKCGQIHDWNL